MEKKNGKDRTKGGKKKMSEDNVETLEETLISEWNPTMRELFSSDTCRYKCKFQVNGKCTLSDNEVIKGGDCKKMMAIALLIDKRPDLLFK